MKKMNFYFNSAKCSALILPILMVLFGTTSWAGNSPSPKNPTTKSVKSPLVVTFTATPAAPTCPGGTGTVSVSAVTTTLASSPYTIGVIVYNSGGAFVGSAVSGVPPGGAIPSARMQRGLLNACCR